MNRSKPIAGVLLSTVAMFALGGCQQAPPPAPTVVVEQPNHHDADRVAADRAAADRQAAADRAAEQQRQADRDAHRNPPPPPH
jgi:hypothetical protein